MAEENIKIKYIIEAEDKASKEIDKIDKSLGSMKKSMLEADKMRKKQDSSSKGFLSTMQKIVTAVDGAFNSLKNLWDLLINLDLEKITRLLVLLSLIMKLKGYDKMASGFANVAKQVAKVNLVVRGMEKGLLKLKEISDGFFSYVLDKVESAIVGFLKWSATLAVTTAAFVGLLASKAVVDVLAASIVYAKGKLFDFSMQASSTFGDKFPKSTLQARKGIGSMISGLDKLQGGVVKTQATLSGYIKTTQSAGSAMYKAFSATELLEKGFYGMVTRMTIGATALTALGTALSRTDSIILKLTGGAMIGLAIALGGIAVVLRQVIVSIGNFVFNVGTSMVNAVKSSIAKMNKLSDSTYTFSFIIRNLNKETEGAIGSFEDWNKTMGEFSKTTGYSMTETQKAVSEMLRFGDSIGLTREQMEELLPIIGDLAEANHKDLFTSTLGVVEALAGQTMMLQNMGVNLTQHAIAETKAGEAVGHHMKKLSASEKVQLRYNALLEKTTTVRGIAASSANTAAGAERRLNTEMEKASLSIGAGAAVIETQFNSSAARFTQHLVKMSEPLLVVTGFLGSLIGRIMQASGLFLQFAFTIIFLTSTITALNIVLKNQAIAKFLISMSQFKPIMKPLAAFLPEMTANLQAFLLRIGTTGLGIKSFGALVVVTAKTIAAGFWAVLAPMLPVIAAITAITATGYLFYKAMQLIDEKSGVFSAIAKDLKEWWANTDAMDAFTAKLLIAAETAVNMGKAMVMTTAQGIIGMMSGLQALSALPIIVARAFIDMGTSIMDTWKNVTASMDEFIGGAPKALLSMLGISTEVTDQLAEMTKKTAEFKTASSDLGSGYLAGIESDITANDRLIASLGEVESAKSKAGTGARGIAGADGEDKQAKFDADLELLRQFNSARIEEDKAFKEIMALGDDLSKNKEFARIQKFLGKEYAAKEAFAVRELLKDGKTEEARTKMIKLNADARTAIAKKAAKDQADAEAKKAKKIVEVKQAQAQIEANLFSAAITMSKEGSATQKAILSAQAIMNTYAGASQAYKDYSWPYSIAVSAAVVAAGLANVAKINGATFFTGGIVDSPSRVGDNNPISVNGGEMVLSKSQQSELFAMTQGVGSGGDNGEAINNLAASIATQPIILEVDGREIARAVRNQISGGFQLA